MTLDPGTTTSAFVVSALHSEQNGSNNGKMLCPVLGSRGAPEFDRALGLRHPQWATIIPHSPPSFSQPPSLTGYRKARTQAVRLTQQYRPLFGQERPARGQGPRTGLLQRQTASIRSFRQSLRCNSGPYKRTWPSFSRGQVATRGFPRSLESGFLSSPKRLALHLLVHVPTTDVSGLNYVFWGSLRTGNLRRILG